MTIHWGDSDSFPAAPILSWKIFAAQRGVHAAIDGPVERIANHRAFGVGRAEIRDQEAALAAKTFHRRRGIRQIENRNAFKPKSSVVNVRGAAHFQNDFCRGKCI